MRNTAIEFENKVSDDKSEERYQTKAEPDVCSSIEQERDVIVIDSLPVFQLELLLTSEQTWNKN